MCLDLVIVFFALSKVTPLHLPTTTPLPPTVTPPAPHTYTKHPGLALFLFTSLEALPIFLEERSIYTREHSRGAYRVLSYSLCNFIIYLPVCLTMSVVFTAISYFMIDLPPTGFVFQILATFMVLLEGNAFATAVSAIAPDPLTVRFWLRLALAAGS